MEEPAADTCGAKYKDLILETIDQLRKRKARPDLERISHMVERRHKISREETRADLEKLVKADIVMKVDYKGNTSYRNAAKWSKRYMILYGTSNPTDVSRKLFDAVQELTAEDVAAAAQAALAAQANPDAPPKHVPKPDRGASHIRIEKWLSGKGTYGNLKEKALKSAVQKEVIAGRLVRLPNGNFKCGDPNKVSRIKLPPPGSPPSSPSPPSKSKSAPATPSGKSGNTKKKSKDGSSKRTVRCFPCLLFRQAGMM